MSLSDVRVLGGHAEPKPYELSDGFCFRPNMLAKAIFVDARLKSRINPNELCDRKLFLPRHAMRLGEEIDNGN